MRGSYITIFVYSVIFLMLIFLVYKESNRMETNNQTTIDVFQVN